MLLLVSSRLENFSISRQFCASRFSYRFLVSCLDRFRVSVKFHGKRYKEYAICKYCDTKISTKGSQTKSENLKKLEKALLTIKASSVESERISSSVGRIATKFRTCLSDENLNSLVILRQYYLSLENKDN